MPLTTIELQCQSCWKVSRPRAQTVISSLFSRCSIPPSFFFPFHLLCCCIQIIRFDLRLKHLVPFLLESPSSEAVQMKENPIEKGDANRHSPARKGKDGMSSRDGTRSSMNASCIPSRFFRNERKTSYERASDEKKNEEIDPL